MALFYLIRHGEPELRGVMLGQMDPSLSATGKQQAAAALGELEVEVVWTSPLRRARQTAGFVLSSRVFEIPELREMDQGEWTGKTWSEIESLWPDLAARRISDWLSIAAPGGETWNNFLIRIRSAWGTIKAGPAPAAIVGHQGVNSALMYLMKGDDPLKFQQGYGEVIRVEYD